MSYDLNITIDQTQGGVLRALGLIERRGFTILSLTLPQSTTAEQKLSVRISPRDVGRSVEVLARQIERLESVRSVEALALSPVTHSALAWAVTEANSEQPAVARSGTTGAAP
jgi:acetolactate synthase regulatory subunit